MRPSRLAVSCALVCLGTLAAAGSGPETGDQGAAGTWQHLQRLRTTASVLYTAAHPDDEQGGLLAWLARGEGARVSLLTLTRGEGGDNAIGPELFDALGLIRTEELLAAGRVYGVDRQYFTPAADYGFSKRLDEALLKWGHERVLAEVVRVIRTDRPLLIVSRWRGDARDGHGNHQAAGQLTREAYQAAGEASAFPEQLAEGLRPWHALKLYVGGLGQDERWTARIDTGAYSPWLGESYADAGRRGLGWQRSQNGGRVSLAPGPSPLFFARLASRLPAPEREESLFDGIPTRLAACYSLFGRSTPPAVRPALDELERQVESAIEAFTVHDPSASVPALARGLSAVREAIRVAEDADVRDVLEGKERQFQQAIAAALGLQLSAVAQRADAVEPSGPYAAFMPAPTLGPVVPGQSFAVVVRLTNRSPVRVTPTAIELRTDRGWQVEPGELPAGALAANATAMRRFAVKLADDVPLGSRPPFTRTSIAESWYAAEPDGRGRSWRAPAAEVMARYTVEGVPVEARAAVQRREATPVDGYAWRELSVVPALSVRPSPRVQVVPVHAPRPISVAVEVTSQVDGPVDGELTLQVPSGWTLQPPRHALALAGSGERRVHRFEVTPSALGAGRFEVRAVARAGGRSYGESVTAVAHRGLETRYLYEPARVEVRGVDVRVAPDLRVGYVMGVGDQVPDAIAQLGAAVELLDEAALASGDLRRFDAIVTGTRAYGARADLRAHNRRLLDYAKAGGHLIVLYNTPPDLDPRQHAPFPGELPRNAEEVSEEDSPVEILAPGHELLIRPNRITAADFEGWIEQRGSKFWASWDPAYTAVIATHDQDQPPQRGGWLTARYGTGRYTYFAYALHRQLPYGVPGAYRLLANLLSASRP